MNPVGFRKFVFPETYSQTIDTLLSENLQTDLSKSKALAEAIKQASDFFLGNPDAKTPWDEKWLQEAYLCYYFPLNYIRSIAVAKEGINDGFFEGLTQVVELGSGLGSASMALEDSLESEFDRLEHIEISMKATSFHKSLLSDVKDKHFWHRSFSPAICSDPAKTLGVFSYVFTELKEPPNWIYDLEALMILEPSTRQDGRELLALRRTLIEKGFSIWAPCTHQEGCPLLEQSKKDWCHDRIHWEMPSWLEKIENHLPIRNRTLTHSYLVARKQKPSQALNTVRITGDSLKEKGKTRQMICRGPEREFFSWLKKQGKAPEISRGTRLETPKGFEKKNSELRLTSEASAELKEI